MTIVGLNRSVKTTRNLKINDRIIDSIRQNLVNHKIGDLIGVPYTNSYINNV